MVKGKTRYMCGHSGNQKRKSDHQANCSPRVLSRKSAYARIEIECYVQSCAQTASYEGGTSRKNRGAKTKPLKRVRYDERKACIKRSKARYI